MTGMSQAPALADGFCRAGALVFGGGHVVLPLLQAAVVAPDWVTPGQPLSGCGAAQAGPLEPSRPFGGGAGTGAERHGGASLALLSIVLPVFRILIQAALGPAGNSTVSAGRFKERESRLFLAAVGPRGLTIEALHGRHPSARGIRSIARAQFGGGPVVRPVGSLHRHAHFFFWQVLRFVISAANHFHGLPVEIMAVPLRKEIFKLKR